MNKRIHAGLLGGLLSLSVLQAQEKTFVVEGSIANLPDGVEVSILTGETISSKTLATTTAKDGHFRLTGAIDRPQLCTLITNNLKQTEQRGWSNDSIQWSYTSFFLTAPEQQVRAERYPYAGEKNYDFTFDIVGGKPQADFTAYQRLLANYRPEEEEQAQWEFIRTNPTSPIAVYLANQLLERGYKLTTEQVDYLAAHIRVPEAPERMREFNEKLQYARHTTRGAALVNLDLTDLQGKTTTLKDILPKGKWVIVDFWASWCGMCLAAMPELQEVEQQYADRGLTVLAISCDEKESAWRNAVAKKHMPWQQYRLTQQGFADFFHKYQVGNGVPYLLFIAPDGKVVQAASNPQDIERLLSEHIH